MYTHTHTITVGERSITLSVRDGWQIMYHISRRTIAGLLFIWFSLLILTSSATYKPNPYASECDRCSVNAECVKNTCQCRYGYIGNPLFACHPGNSSFCSIISDPRVDMFDKGHYSGEMIADVLAADVTSVRGKGKCRLTVWTFLNRNEGKMFVSEIQFKLLYTVNYAVAKTTIKIIASVEYGAYVFRVYSSEGYGFVYKFTVSSDDTAYPRSISVQQCKINFLSTCSGLLTVDINCCGVQLGLRPHSPESPSVIPGFFIDIDGTFHPEFPQSYSTAPLCLYDNQVNLTRITGFKDDVDSLVYLALTNSQMQPPFSNMPPKLPVLRSTLRKCCRAEKRRFIRFFQDVLSDPPLVRAVSHGIPGLSELVKFLSLVLNYLCGADDAGCDQARAVIASSEYNASFSGDRLAHYC
ncbi:hypothetical protein Btru_009911 [Bulinus truncatus]|nr:hypothetical protein Btru_009911 [Bulinus truncatus]